MCLDVCSCVNRCVCRRVHVYVCLCVCQRERERDTHTDIVKEGERESQTGSEHH